MVCEPTTRVFAVNSDMSPISHRAGEILAVHVYQRQMTSKHAECTSSCDKRLFVFIVREASLKYGYWRAEGWGSCMSFPPSFSMSHKYPRGVHRLSSTITAPATNYVYVVAFMQGSCSRINVHRLITEDQNGPIEV